MNTTKCSAVSEAFMLISPCCSTLTGCSAFYWNVLHRVDWALPDHSDLDWLLQYFTAFHSSLQGFFLLYPLILIIFPPFFFPAMLPNIILYQHVMKSKDKDYHNQCLLLVFLFQCGEKLEMMGDWAQVSLSHLYITLPVKQCTHRASPHVQPPAEQQYVRRDDDLNLVWHLQRHHMLPYRIHRSRCGTSACPRPPTGFQGYETWNAVWNTLL